MTIIDFKRSAMEQSKPTLNVSVTVPKGATVMRVYARQVYSDGSESPLTIRFEGGDPKDYLWTTWSKSTWKSLDYLSGIVDDNNRTIKGEQTK